MFGSVFCRTKWVFRGRLFTSRSSRKIEQCDNVETNKDRRYTVTLEEFNVVIDCLDCLELRGFLAFARLAGMRPSDIVDLRFCDIKPSPNERMYIHVPPTGKTGERFVPLFDNLRPFYEAFIAAKREGQVYVFERCRKFTWCPAIIDKVFFGL